MEITVGSKLKVSNPTDDMIRWCKRNLIINNPDFFKKEKMGKWTGNTPRYIFLFEKVGMDLYLPFGCLQELWNQYGQTCPFHPTFRAIERINYQSGIVLYPYQEKAAQAIFRAKNGVVVMPCGAGKTQTALEAVARIGGRTLWLTHTQDLMNQSMNRAKSCLEIDSKTFGTITGGKVNIGTSLTFATVQTMSKIDLRQYEDAFDVVIVDECHHAIGSPTRVMQFYKVLSSLSARYKIGLTATPKRADGLERSMFALLGGIICEISKDEVKHTTCPVEVHGIKTGYTPDYDAVLAGDGTLNYAQLVDDLTHNEERFQCVCNVLKTLDESTLVLANRVEYLQRLCDQYDGNAICLSTLGTSKKAKEIRKEALRKLDCGELDCIFATWQLAAEGLDCPHLKYVVFATPEKNERTVQQAAGRVERNAEGKDRGIIIDLIDEFGMYKGWWRKRSNLYKKAGYDIM